MILVDTDVMVDIVRGHAPAVAWAKSCGEDRFALPGFVAMELVQGCRDGVALRRIEAHLAKHRILWPSWKACREALDDQLTYHLSHGLGMYDALVGRMAVDLAVPLHTFNEKHYQVIPGLTTVQPYQR